MTSHLLQSAKGTAQFERQPLHHSQADNYVRFLCAVSMLRNCGEAYADDSGVLKKLREQIDVQGGNPIVKNNDELAVVFYLTHGPAHFGEHSP